MCNGGYARIRAGGEGIAWARQGKQPEAQQEQHLEKLELQLSQVPVLEVGSAEFP